jgi:hypothetical protein
MRRATRTCSSRPAQRREEVDDGGGHQRMRRRGLRHRQQHERRILQQQPGLAHDAAMAARTAAVDDGEGERQHAIGDDAPRRIVERREQRHDGRREDREHEEEGARAPAMAGEHASGMPGPLVVAIGDVGPEAELHDQENEESHAQRRIGRSERGLHQEAGGREEDGQRGDARHRDALPRVRDQLHPHRPHPGLSRVPPTSVRTRRGRARFHGAAIYRVRRLQ